MSPPCQVLLGLVQLLAFLSPAQSQATTIDGERMRKVTQPPLIVVQPEKKIPFREEESIELTCVATGEPEPEYYWKFNNKLFSPSGNDGRIAIQPGVGTLIFARPIMRDEGIYQCFATNKHGVAVSVKVDLRLGILDPFPTSSLVRHYPSVGMPLTLKCTPPRSYPQAQTFWATVAEGQRFTPIDLTDRISIDPIGNLQFANVLPEDRQDGRHYVCIVENRVMRRTQHGAYQLVFPSDNVMRRMSPLILWQAPTHQVALRGQTWKIKCIFSGSPTPRVTWTRAGKPMPSGMREESFGQELVVENVQFEDAGDYECQGINEETTTPIRRSFSLTVESMPYWEVEPISIDAAEEAKAEFACQASGRPDPVIFWYINGDPISAAKKDPRRVVTKNMITIYNVTNKDAMVIQCNATNKNGYLFANAYLNVQTESPLILTPPMKRQYVAEGQDVQLQCEVFGSPVPRIIWQKANEQLTGGRFEVVESGNLQISDVSVVDAGDYTCTATNRLGEDSATGTLVVRRKTRIKTPPLELMVFEGTEAKFTCTATTDPEEIDNLQIDWKKDGQIINYALAQRVFRNKMDNSLTISGTISLDTGKYTCYAHNGLDSDEAHAQLVVQAPPDAPNNVRVRCYENEKPGRAEVEWQPGKENYAPILNFIIQYNTTFAPDTWINIADDLQQNERKRFVELSPFGNYTFRLLARNKIGLSTPSLHTRNVCRTLEDVPDKNPDNVIGEGDEPNNLVIYWTPMPKNEQNGPHFKYLVSWKRDDIEDDEEKTVAVEISEAYHYVVPGDVPTFKPYKITVKAKNGVGDARVAPVPVIGYSGEAEPTVTPYDVTVLRDSIEGTRAKMTWTAVDDDPDIIRGFFRGYRIQFWKTKEGTDTIREVDHIINQPKQYPRPRNKRQTDMVEYTLENLPPYSDITVLVRVLNKYYVGPPSDPAYIKTLEGVPGPPVTFEVIARGSTHVELVWEKPAEPNGVLVGYVMSYQRITGLNLGRLQYREDITDPDQLRAKLTGLSPVTDYRIYLSAVTRVGKGEEIFLDGRTTSPGRPSAPTFEVMDIGETFVNVSWEPSRSGNPGSVFYLQYRPRGEYGWLATTDEVLNYQMTIGLLDPGTTYQLRAVSKNGAGDEAPAEWQEVTTGGIGPGRVDLKTAGWFYGIFAALLLILLFMVGFVFLKRVTDDWWERKEAEIEEQVRQLQAEEAIRQMGIVNQYAVTGSHEMIDSSYADRSTDYYGHKEPIDDGDSFDEDEEDAAAGFGKAQYPSQQGNYPQQGYGPQGGGYDPGYQQQQLHAAPPPSQPPKVIYRHGVPVEMVPRSSPDVTQEAYIQDGRYHLQQDPQQHPDSAPSFV